MAENNTNAQASQPASAPNSALRSLDRLVGTWRASDPSGAGAISGQTTFEWMEGGCFLMQHVNFDGAKGIEIIGYDEESKSLKSHYFDQSGVILEYTYVVDDDTMTVSIDMPRAKGQFIGKFSEDGDEATGRWEWTQDGVQMGYDATLTRIKR